MAERILPLPLFLRFCLKKATRKPLQPNPKSTKEMPSSSLGASRKRISKGMDPVKAKTLLGFWQEIPFSFIGIGQ